MSEPLAAQDKQQRKINEINLNLRIVWRGRTMGRMVELFALIWGGLVAARQHGNQPKEKTSSSISLSFLFFLLHLWMKLMKLIEWIKLREEMKAERAGKEKNTTKERENAARLNSLWVGYELAAHLRGSTPQINFTIIQLICLASLAAPQKKDEPTLLSLHKREGTQPFLFCWMGREKLRQIKTVMRLIMKWIKRE